MGWTDLQVASISLFMSTQTREHIVRELEEEE
jgi:hypothetical protein